MWIPRRQQQPARLKPERRGVSLGARVKGWARLPVRGVVAVGAALRSACLLIRRPWASPAAAERPSPSPRVKAWAPSPKQVQFREKAIHSLVRLDTEGVFSRFYKLLWAGDISEHLSNPTRLSSTVERSLEERSPLLQWHLKHHSPAGLLHWMGSALPPLPSLDDLVAALRVGEVPADAAALGSATAQGGRAPSGMGKGAELNEALRPIVDLNVALVAEAARRRPAAAPIISLHAAHAGYLLGLWRAACVLGLPPERRYGLMNAFLCKVAQAVATCRAQIDAADCAEGSECRSVLDGEACAADY